MPIVMMPLPPPLLVHRATTSFLPLVLAVIDDALMEIEDDGVGQGAEQFLFLFFT